MMPLYKYMAPERTDILEKGLIRFTQPSAFNDPFETFPCFTAGIPDEYIQDFLGNHEPFKSELKKMVKESFEEEMGKYPNIKIPFEAAFKHIQPMADDIFMQLMSGEGKFFHAHTIKAALNAINKQFGVLCLTENPHNLLMWAHYSASHSGFVLELDEKHQFFSRRTKPEEFGRYLKKVQYTRVRPQTILFDPRLKEEDCRNAWATAIFFSKSEHWAYEEEWRMVEYLKECTHIVRGEPYDVYLFPIPMDCITGIIFGCRTLDTIKSSIRRLVHTNSACSHIYLSEATIDEKEYRLNFSSSA
jgi:hypothetical protein